MLTAEKLLTPPDGDGDLDRKVLWPGESETVVLDKLDAYLLKAYVEGSTIDDTGDRDQFARYWANSLALFEVHRRVLINPSTVTLNDQGSGSWLVTQIQDIERIATEQRDLAVALLALYEDAEVSTAPVTRESACVRTYFT